MARNVKDQDISPADKRKKMLELAISSVEKQYGKGAVMRLGEKDEVVHVPTISTGSLSLDIALGTGGYPRGRIIEVFGPEASGKTTLALHAVAEVQKRGGIALYVDAEHALDMVYARKLGVDVDNILISQPDYGEQALDIADQFIRSGGVDIVVIDSVAALVPKAELEGEMGDPTMGAQARLMSQALRKLAASIHRSSAIVIFINQIRTKIGGPAFANPETTTGGLALKFYSTIRLDIRGITKLREGNEIVGTRTRVKVVKNKLAPPFREAEFDILYGKGVSKEGEIIDLGVAYGVIEKTGSWYSYGNERLGQGRDAVRKMLEENHELSEEIKEKILEKAGLREAGTSEGDVKDGAQ